MYNLIGMPCISLFADIRHEWGLPDPYQVYVLRGGGGVQIPDSTLSPE